MSMHGRHACGSPEDRRVGFFGKSGMGRTERVLVCCVATLICLGVVMIYSVASARSADPREGGLALARQLVWVGMGCAGLLIAYRVNYRKLSDAHFQVLLVALVLLVAVLAPGIGTIRHGARRWIRMNWLIGFQPSEFAKLALCIFLAGFLSRRQERLGEFRNGFLPVMCVIGIVSGLILLEPDFGTAVLVGVVGAMMAIVAGVRVLHMAAAACVAAPMLLLALWRSPARWARIAAFLDPWSHESGAGYQVIQSLIALGSGGLIGRGLGASHQKLYFLPEARTDFIFAIVGEELGAAGTVAVVFLFAILLREGLRVAGRAQDAFGSLLAFGITMMLGLQAAMNMAVVTGSVPTKGIALPFVSAGGSSLWCSMVGVGLLMQIARRNPAPSLEDRGMEEPAFPRPRDVAEVRVPLPSDF